jgi:hypothetical protein
MTDILSLGVENNVLNLLLTKSGRRKQGEANVEKSVTFSSKNMPILHFWLTFPVVLAGFSPSHFMYCRPGTPECPSPSVRHLTDASGVPRQIRNQINHPHTRRSGSLGAPVQ